MGMDVECYRLTGGDEEMSFYLKQSQIDMLKEKYGYTFDVVSPEFDDNHLGECIDKYYKEKGYPLEHHLGDKVKLWDVDDLYTTFYLFDAIATEDSIGLSSYDYLNDRNPVEEFPLPVEWIKHTEYFECTSNTCYSEDYIRKPFRDFTQNTGLNFSNNGASEHLNDIEKYFHSHAYYVFTYSEVKYFEDLQKYVYNGKENYVNMLDEIKNNPSIVVMDW